MHALIGEPRVVKSLPPERRARSSSKRGHLLSAGRDDSYHARAELARVHSRLSGRVRSRATRVAYGVGGGRDVQVGAQGTVVRAVLEIRGTYSGGRRCRRRR